MFQHKERQEQFEVVRSLTSYKIKEGGSMCAQVQQMKSYIEKLENLHIVFDNNLVVDLVLGSLPSSYDKFIMTYRLNSVEKTLMEQRKGYGSM